MKTGSDTNVTLDVLCNRPDFLENSLKIWKLCEVKKIEGYISALSIPNIVYILRKELTPQKTMEIISRLMTIFEVAELRSSDLKNAAEMCLNDYEDAVQMCCAKRIKASYIVTRNVRDFKKAQFLRLNRANCWIEFKLYNILKRH